MLMVIYIVHNVEMSISASNSVHFFIISGLDPYVVL